MIDAVVQLYDTNNLALLLHPWVKGVDTGIRQRWRMWLRGSPPCASQGVDVGELLLWTGVGPTFGFTDPDGNGLYFVEVDRAAGR